MFGTLVAYPVGENERIQMVKNKQKAQLQSLEKTKKRLAGFVSAFRARNALLGQVLERWGCQDQRGSGPATCLVGGQAGQHGICPTPHLWGSQGCMLTSLAALALTGPIQQEVWASVPWSGSKRTVSKVPSRVEFVRSLPNSIISIWSLWLSVASSLKWTRVRSI